MTPLPQNGSLVADKYRVERLLGAGGMGAVFRARHLLMDRAVALKWLQPELSHNEEARDRFLREARAAARIRHPNVVEVYDVGEHEGALFMVLELLEGESLEQLMHRGDAPIGRLLHLLIGAMHGVAAAHRHGIIHRDIKPENLFVVASTACSESLVKVLDFGISKLTNEPRTGHLTQHGATVGTPLFMSCEQLQGASDVDVRADVYSFGVLLYRALTGIIPFDAESVAAVAVLVATYRPPSPRQLRPEIPEALSHVVMKAMAFDRADRYACMDDLIHALHAVEASDGFMARPLGVARDLDAPAPSAVSLGLASIRLPEPTALAASALPSPIMRAWLPVGVAGMLVVGAIAAGLWLLLPAREQARVARARPDAAAAAAKSGVPHTIEERSPTAPSVVEAAPKREAKAKPVRRGSRTQPAPPRARRLLRKPDF